MTKQLNDGERLAVVETNIENLSTTLREGLTDIKTSVKEINDKVDKLTPNVVTEDKLSGIVASLRKEMVQSKQSRLKDTVIQLLITAPIAALIGFFFASVTG